MPILANRCYPAYFPKRKINSLTISAMLQPYLCAATNYYGNGLFGNTSSILHDQPISVAFNPWHLQTQVSFLNQGHIKNYYAVRVRTNCNTQISLDSMRKSTTATLVTRCRPENYTVSVTLSGGRDNVVSTATRYGLGGQEIESRWRRDLPHPSRPALGITHPPVQWERGFFPGGKAAGTWPWPPIPSNAEVKVKVQL
jgi:hypothetical protein